MSTITIFTPTYNRAHLLPRVFESLVKQTSKDFEWVIVDDGSEDGTETLIEDYQRGGLVAIRYFRQANAGKHIAVNYAVTECHTELFAILDSDDELVDNAVETIQQEWAMLKSENNVERFAGIVTNKVFNSGAIVGSKLDYERLDTTVHDYRFKRKIVGDKFEIFRTEVLRKFPFPDNGEKFCPEALVWNRIGAEYIFRFLNVNIYVCEYLPGGLSDRITTIRKKSPVNTSTYYAELAQSDIPYAQKIKATINYWRFAKYDKKATFARKFARTNFFLNLMTILPAFLKAYMERRK